jgi:hypothetical protein
MRLVIAIAALAAGTVSAEPAKPRLDMVTFFTGKTHAENVMKVALKTPVKMIVDSVGGKGDRGDFVLIDTIREGDKPPRQRKWIMRPTGPNRFGGTLSDATGPVDIMVAGNSAIIRYTMKGGLKIEQVLELQPDGKTLSNHVDARKFGMKFGRVDGTIRKLD